MEYDAATTYYHVARFTLCDGCKEEGELTILVPGKETEIVSASYKDDDAVEEYMRDYPGAVQLFEYDEVAYIEKLRKTGL